MTVSTFVVSSSDSMPVTTWPLVIDGNLTVLARVGGAFASHQQAEADMTVAVDPGYVFDGVSLTEIGAQSTSTISAPVENPRIDRIVIDRLTGLVSVVPGVEAPSPSAPDIPAGTLPIARVLLQITSTVITNDMITDERAVNWAGMSGSGGHGQCRLRLVGSDLVLSPYNGNKLIIDGVNYSIPSSGVSLAPAGLTASTLYYIYAYESSGAMALEASTTFHATDSTTGVEIKSGDASRTLVGMAYMQTAATWPTQATLLLNWFNRRMTSAKAGFTSSHTTTSTGAFVEIDTEIRVPFLVWSDSAADYAVSGEVTNSTVSVTTTGLAIDNITPIAASAGIPAATIAAVPLAIPGTATGLAEGYHYATLVGAVGAGIGQWIGGVTSTVSAQVQLAITVEG